MILISEISTFNGIITTLISLFMYAYGHYDIEEQQLTLLISLDGFRHDYLSKIGGGKNFKILLNRGTSVEGGLVNAFITKTIPNHFTLVTGLYEESHGMVANDFYDPNLKEQFDISFPGGETDPRWWDVGGVPVWISNEEHHSDDEQYVRRSGVYMWPGSLSTFHGKKPFYTVDYNMNITFKERIDTVVSWFASKTHPINFGVLYYHEPDYTGHEFGPEAKEMEDLLWQLDDDIGYLIERLKHINIFHRTNIVITSDHGMTTTEHDNVVVLSNFVDLKLLDEYSNTPVPHIWPRDGHYDDVYSALKDKHPQMNVYKKEDIPKEYHYQENDRIPPILISMDLGWSVVNNQTDVPNLHLGNHGYNNSLDAMHPFFIARGPAFKENYVSPQINNVDVYPLLCHILNIPKLSNNGSIQHVRNMLRSMPHFNFPITALTFFLAIFGAACISGVFCITVWKLRSVHVSRRNLRHRVSLTQHPQSAHLLQSDEEIP